MGAGESKVRMLEISGIFVPWVEVALWGRPAPPLDPDPGGVGIFGDFDTFDPNPS